MGVYVCTWRCVGLFDSVGRRVSFTIIVLDVYESILLQDTLARRARGFVGCRF